MGKRFIVSGILTCALALLHLDRGSAVIWLDAVLLWIGAVTTWHGLRCSRSMVASDELRSAEPFPAPPTESGSARTVSRGDGHAMGGPPSASDDEAFHTVPLPAAGSGVRRFRLPDPPEGSGPGRWVSPGDVTVLPNVALPGGMVYVGDALEGGRGRQEPSLITVGLPVDLTGHCATHPLDPWSGSYAHASAPQRGAYLRWLAEGRSDAQCSIGYVLLFFYGLERRVVMDTAQDPSIRREWPAIAAELRRLRSIYGAQSAHLQRQASMLLGLIELHSAPAGLYQQPLPDDDGTWDAWALPPLVGMALGQAVVDRARIPAHLALAWLRGSPEVHLRTAAVRCPAAFERLFAERYREVFGDGMRLPRSRTPLTFWYAPISPSLR